jgi:DNA-binding transcriptional regulator GbsR (MarR family)
MASSMSRTVHFFHKLVNLKNDLVERGPSAVEAAGDVGPVARFVEDFASITVESGVPRMPARVFACLMAAEGGRLTAAQLSERLRASPAAISGAVRYLTQVHLATRTREPGSRRDLYVVEHEVLYRAMLGRDVLLQRWIDRIDEGIDLLGRGSEPATRLREMREFLAFLMKELASVIGRWEQHRRTLGLDDGLDDGLDQGPVG